MKELLYAVYFALIFSLLVVTADLRTGFEFQDICSSVILPPLFMISLGADRCDCSAHCFD